MTKHLSSWINLSVILNGLLLFIGAFMSQGEQTILINRYISIAKQGNTVATSDFMFDVNMKQHLALSSC